VAEQADAGPGAEEHPEQVHLDDAPGGVVGHQRHLVHARDARVVHERVEPAEPGAHLGEERLHVLLGRHVAPHVLVPLGREGGVPRATPTTW